MSTRPRACAPRLLDLPGIAAELVAGVRKSAAHTLERIVVDDAGLTTTVTAMRRGGGIAEHAAPCSAVLVPILGRLRFATGNGSTDLTPARFVSIPRGSRYEILADDDAVFMLVADQPSIAACGDDAG